MFTGLQCQYLLNMFTAQIGIIMYAKYIPISHFKSESSIPVIGYKEQHLKEDVESAPTITRHDEDDDLCSPIFGLPYKLPEKPGEGV